MRGIYSSGQIKVLTVRPEEAALVLAERKRSASCHETVRSRVADESENECERSQARRFTSPCYKTDGLMILWCRCRIDVFVADHIGVACLLPRDSSLVKGNFDFARHDEYSID
jgi:hypothetical protein